MIRAMQAIGIMTLLLTGLVLALCVLENRRTDPSAPQTMTTIDSLRQTPAGGMSRQIDLTPPLVQQAQAFALYLNPPSTSPRPLSPARGGRTASTSPERSDGDISTAAEVRPASSSAMFELHGISYYRADPDRSMAMICEPGGSRRWVRQGDRLGHITIERIENDCLVYLDGTRLQTMALASSDAMERFASTMDAGNRKVTPPSAPPQDGPVPIPVRGLRQMPASRVAAKLGRTSLEAVTPD